MKTLLYTIGIICCVFGTFIQASALAPGNYKLLIQETPELYVPGSGIPDVGIDGDWNSSFTFGGLPSQFSNLLIDNPATVNNYGYGTGDDGLTPNTYGDGWAGELDITVDETGSVTFNSLQVDVVANTAGGNFAQFGPLWNMSGTIDASGNIAFDPNGRYGHIDGPAGGAQGRWLVDDITTPGKTTWELITTGTVSGPAGTATGSPIWTDTNGDMWAVLVHGGAVGSEWGPYGGHPDYEIWRVHIVSGSDLCTHVICDDTNPCNGIETCDPTDGSCIPGTSLVCDDGNLCTDDSCDTVTGCQYIPNTNPCDDGDKCTTADTCSGGTCLGAPVTCDDGNACTVDSCNAGNGLCDYILNCELPGCDGSVDPACADCLTNIDCDDGNACTDDICDGVGKCVYAPNTNPCDDGNLCTSGDTCSNGSCSGTSIVCDDGNLCTDDVCDPGNGLCIYTDNTAPCDDGDSCTVDDTCTLGVCVGTLSSTPEGPQGDPTCSDGVDNDCDGMVDASDPDCGGTYLPAGTYSFLVEETPPFLANPGIADVGSPGDWNTSFTFGGLPGFSSARLIDNSILMNNYGYGTGDDGLSPNVFADGWAGVISINLDSLGMFTVNSYQMDVVNWTSGGNYAQFGPVTGMGGYIDTAGNIFFEPSGRRGAIDGPPGGWVADFNIDDFTDTSNTSVWDSYTTGSVAGGVSGSPVSVNGQGEMWASLVSTGAIGSQWGVYYGYPYYDIWKVKIVNGSCGVEGPAGDATCSDGLDNDCDGSVDSADPHCGKSCFSNGECGNTSLYCAKAQGDCSGTGTCQLKPLSCPAPGPNLFCGCNGTTYDDSCLVAVDGVNISSIGECSSVCTDFDGDGYSIEGGTCGPEDCDISNPNVNPGAAELCNDGIDNDCDLLIDNDDPDCALCTGLQSVTIRGGGGKPTTTDMQIQVQFTVLGFGGIISNNVKSLTVCPGTALAYFTKAGSGPDPDSLTLDGVAINPSSLQILVVNGPHKMIVSNRGNGGKDTDKITITIPIEIVP